MADLLIVYRGVKEVPWIAETHHHSFWWLRRVVSFPGYRAGKFQDKIKSLPAYTHTHTHTKAYRVAVESISCPTTFQ
jgi:hypothetical protein